MPVSDFVFDDSLASATPPVARFLRPADLLVFALSWTGYRYAKEQARLVRDAGAGDPRLLVTLPPQHFLETAYLDSAPPSVAAGSLSAGASWLVFRPVSAPETIELSRLSEVLSTWKWDLVLVADRDRPEPDPLATAIEAPFRLFLSPIAPVGLDRLVWRLARDPVDGQRTSLWYAQFSTQSSVGTPLPDRQWLRAFSVARSAEGTPPDPALVPATSGTTVLAMKAADRTDILHNSANAFAAGDENGYLHYRKLIVSAVGATIDLEGRWPDADIELVYWRHLMSFGRDQYVKLVKRGVLVPTGHPAVFITITERTFAQGGAPGAVAYLHQRSYVVPTEPVRSRPRSAHPASGRDMPFHRWEMKTRIVEVEKPADENLFWAVAPVIPPLTPKRNQLFELHAIDALGSPVRIATPMVFALDPGQQHPELRADSFKQGADLFNTAPDAFDPKLPTLSRERPLEAALVALASDAEPTPDAVASLAKVRLETVAVTLAARRFDKLPDGIARPATEYLGDVFAPALDAFSARTAATQMIGKADGLKVRYADRWLKDGFDSAKNAGEVFAEAVEKKAVDFAGKAQLSGGLMKPAFQLAGLSREFGAVIGDAESYCKGLLGGDLFGEGKLLGFIPLKEIIGQIEIHAKDPHTPRIVRIVTGDTIAFRYTWVLSPNPWAGIVSFDADSELRVEVEVSVRAAPGVPRAFSTRGSINGLTISFDPLVVKFRQLRFELQSGGSPRFHVDLESIAVGGQSPLSAVQDLLSQAGGGVLGSVAPLLEVRGDSILAGLRLHLPDLAIGVFALQHLDLAADIDLSLGGEQPLGMVLQIGEPSRPFLLSVTIFGGGGSFLIGVGADGLREVQLTLEFGGVLAINLGVAEGEAHAMGGIYLHYLAGTPPAFNEAPTGGTIELAAYLRVGGSLSVLDLITVSVEFYMRLEYSSNPRMLSGRATVTVSVHVLFFSESVELTVERNFSLGTSETQVHAAIEPAPAFADSVPDHETWSDYVGAFA